MFISNGIPTCSNNVQSVSFGKGTLEKGNEKYNLNQTDCVDLMNKALNSLKEYPTTEVGEHGGLKLSREHCAPFPGHTEYLSINCDGDLLMKKSKQDYSKSHEDTCLKVAIKPETPEEKSVFEKLKTAVESIVDEDLSRRLKELKPKVRLRDELAEEMKEERQKRSIIDNF